MSSNSPINIHDEENYDPTVWVPEVHSHGTKDIMKIFWYLTGLTIIDIAFYFIMPVGMLRNWIFIVLGIVKAVLIVGTFMHLKHETMSLILIIVLPMVFVIFLIYWLLYEGNFWLHA